MPAHFESRDYRGATIEDLDIRPAISINPSASIEEAIEIAFENEFTNLPVIHEQNKKLLGILNIESVKRVDHSFLKPIVKNYMMWFSQKMRTKYDEEMRNGASAKTALTTTIKSPTKGRKYRVLTPNSPLEELAQFFNGGNEFAIITSPEGSIVYGVATPDDLIKYEVARPKL